MVPVTVGTLRNQWCSVSVCDVGSGTTRPGPHAPLSCAWRCAPTTRAGPSVAPRRSALAHMSPARVRTTSMRHRRGFSGTSKQPRSPHFGWKPKIPRSPISVMNARGFCVTPRDRERPEVCVRLTMSSDYAALRLRCSCLIGRALDSSSPPLRPYWRLLARRLRLCLMPTCIRAERLGVPHVMAIDHSR